MPCLHPHEDGVTAGAAGDALGQAGSVLGFCCCFCSSSSAFYQGQLVHFTSSCVFCLSRAVVVHKSLQAPFSGCLPGECLQDPCAAWGWGRVNAHTGWDEAVFGICTENRVNNDHIPNTRLLIQSRMGTRMDFFPSSLVVVVKSLSGYRSPFSTVFSKF